MASCFLCNKTLGFFNTPANGRGTTKDGFSVCVSCHAKISLSNVDMANRMKEYTKDELTQLSYILQQEERKERERKEHKEMFKQEKKEVVEQKYTALQESKDVQKRRIEEIKEIIKKTSPGTVSFLSPEIKELSVLLMNDEIIEKAYSGRIEYIGSKKGKTNHGLIVATNYRIIFIYKPFLGFGMQMEDFAYDKITSISLDTGFLKSKIRVSCSSNTTIIDIMGGAKQLSEFIRQKTIQKPSVQQVHLHSDTGTGVLEQIEKLASMKEKGIISNEEFETMKQKLMEKL